MLPQLLNDNSKSEKMKANLEKKSIRTFSDLPIKMDNPLSSRRRMECCLKTFMIHEQKMELKERVMFSDEIFKNACEMTIQNPALDSQYKKYKVVCYD